MGWAGGVGSAVCLQSVLCVWRRFWHDRADGCIDGAIDVAHVSQCEVLRLCHPCLEARASTTVADRVAACHYLCLNRPCLMYLVACW